MGIRGDLGQAPLCRSSMFRLWSVHPEITCSYGHLTGPSQPSIGLQHHHQNQETINPAALHCGFS